MGNSVRAFVDNSHELFLKFLEYHIDSIIPRFINSTNIVNSRFSIKGGFLTSHPKGNKIEGINDGVFVFLDVITKTFTLLYKKSPERSKSRVISTLAQIYSIFTEKLQKIFTQLVSGTHYKSVFGDDFFDFERNTPFFQSKLKLGLYNEKKEMEESKAKYVSMKSDFFMRSMASFEVLSAI